MGYTHHYGSPLGGIRLESDGEALTGLWFEGQGRGAHAEASEARALPVFLESARWLNTYFSGQAPDFTPKLCLRGTAFRMAVWELLLTIPFGQTVTYGQLADQIARRQGLGRMSAQAVGGALAHNPISLIVPCHRVIGAGGRLTGYAGGLDRKRWLLEMEQVHAASAERRI